MSDKMRQGGVSSRGRRGLGVALAAALSLCGAPALAATFVVTNTNASGAGSLPDAVAQANGIAGTHTINITATGTLTLATAIGVGQTMIINGPAGAPGFTIDGGSSAQLVVIQPITSASGPVTMNNLTFSHGHSATSGGALVVSAGTTLNVSGCIFSSNSAVTGGGAIAVATGATLAVTGSTFSANSATGAAGPGGGAVWADTTSTVTLTNSTFSGNTAAATATDTGGGAINFHGTSLMIQGSTVTGNYATGGEGGALLLFGTTGIENSTFVSNDAFISGAAIYVGAGLTDIRNATITGNGANYKGVACGGLVAASFGSPAASASIRNTVLSGNSGSNNPTFAIDCMGPVTSNGYNMLGDRGYGCNFGSNDISTTAPQLGALGSNGGPTQTLLPLAGSPAIDAGNPAGCLALGGGVMAVDQRGLPRPSGPRCDIGAVEVQVGPATPPALTAAFNPVTITAGQNSTLTFTVTNPAGSSAVSGIAFTNLLPAGVVLATAPAASQCGGTVSGTAGGGTFALAGGAIASSPGTCTVVASVTSTVPNTYNELPANATGLANLTDAGLAASLMVQAATPPALTAAFNPVTITVGQTSTLTFTITNPSGSSAAGGIAFVNALPAGVVLASAPSASQCGGTVIGTAGGGTFALAGGSIATSPGTCMVAVSVTSTVPNTYQELPANVSGLANLTDAGLAASLTIQAGTGPAGLTISKSAPATVVSGQTLTYTLTYGNSGGAAAPSVVIRDTIPAGTTFVSATNGGTVQGTDVVWNIASVPAGATNLTVSFTVTVTAATGSITNGTYSITSVAGLVTAGGPVVVTLVNLPISSVPALGPTGFALLAIGIAGAALTLMRFRA